MGARTALAIGPLVVAVAASAQVTPLGGGVEQRVQWIEYRDTQVVPVRASPGYQVMIELAPDERIENVAVGDSIAWQVTASKAGNILFLKPLQTGVTTNMTVVTDVRTYNFELTGVEDVTTDLPYDIRFRYPSVLLAPPGLDGVEAAGPMVGTYRLDGDKNLRPAAISDDGMKTYIDWPANGPLPAVYAKGRDDRETLVNGNMRGRYFVIDSVEPELVFRIDKRRARARRDKTAVKP